MTVSSVTPVDGFWWLKMTTVEFFLWRVDLIILSCNVEKNWKCDRRGLHFWVYIFNIKSKVDRQQCDVIIELTSVDFFFKMKDWFYDFKLKCWKKLKMWHQWTYYYEGLISWFYVEVSKKIIHVWSWPIGSGLWPWINFIIFLLKCHHLLTHQDMCLTPDCF